MTFYHVLIYRYPLPHDTYPVCLPTLRYLGERLTSDLPPLVVLPGARRSLYLQLLQRPQDI